MNYTIGFSVGPASIGWSVLENDPSGSPQKIQDLGVRMFTPPEHPKTGISFATHRRESRIKRRYLRRRRYRKERIKALFVSVGLITQERLNCLFSHSDFEKDVYTLRAEGLDRKLTPEEWVRVLLHLSQRCGYFSSSTTDIESAEKTGIVKQTIAENQALLKEKSYRTVGEMFCLDPKFQITASDGRLWRSTRNHFDCYKINVTHEMMEDEVTALFQAQRSTGNPYASAAFQERYTDILFTRRSFDEGPGGDSPFRIRDSRGFCPFEKTKRRAFKSCYTFEFFSLLQGINKIRILSDQVPSRPLNSDEREIITALAHEKSNLTFWDLRNAIALPIESTFNVVPYRQSSIREAESKRLFRALQSYHMIREALGTIDITFFPSDTLDQVSEILNLYHRPERRMDALLQLGLSFEAAQALLPLTFYKVGNLSLEAMKKLIPYLEQGISYPVACSAVYGAQISPYKLQKFLTLNPELKNSGALDAFVHPTMLRVPPLTDQVTLTALGEKQAEASGVEVYLDGFTVDGKQYSAGENLKIESGHWFWNGDAYCWRIETDFRQPDGMNRTIEVSIPVGAERTLDFQGDIWRGFVEIASVEGTQIFDTYSEVGQVVSVSIGSSQTHMLVLDQLEEESILLIL